MVTYDCIHHFEPRTARPLSSPFDSPESVFMFQDTLVIFDHLYQNLKLVSHLFLPSSSSSSSSPPPSGPSSSASPSDGTSIPALYASAVSRVRHLASLVLSSSPTPLPHQPPIIPNQQFTSNVGKVGYESFVTALKKHIVKGDIIQAVPSQRLTRPTSLHPFNAYRQLRSLNPSPYMFYVDFGDLQLVGASPETLCKVEKRKVYNHAIAGTVKRGKTPEGSSFFLRFSLFGCSLVRS
jgi:anthranilate synthase component 1